MRALGLATGPVRVPVADILAKLVTLIPFPGTLVHQVATQVGKLIDLALMTVMNGKAAKTWNGVRASFVSVLDLLDNHSLLNHYLLRHVRAGVAAAEGHSSICLGSDEGHVGMNLDVGVFVFPSNKCAIAVPQVS